MRLRVSDKTYYLPKRKRILALGSTCFCLGLLPSLISFCISGEDFLRTMLSGLPLTVIFLFLSGAIFHWARKSRVVISDSGIECYDVDRLIGLYTDWSNINKIEVTPNSIIVKLYKPGKPTQGFFKILANRALVNPYIIDLSNFVDSHKNSDLLHDIRDNLQRAQ